MNSARPHDSVGDLRARERAVVGAVHRNDAQFPLGDIGDVASGGIDARIDGPGLRGKGRCRAGAKVDGPDLAGQDEGGPAAGLVDGEVHDAGAAHPAALATGAFLWRE